MVRSRVVAGNYGWNGSENMHIPFQLNNIIGKQSEKKMFNRRKKEQIFI